MEAKRVAELFTETGVWSGPAVTMKGRAELEKGFARRRAQAERTSRRIFTSFLREDA